MSLGKRVYNTAFLQQCVLEKRLLCLARKCCRFVIIIIIVIVSITNVFSLQISIFSAHAL